MPLKKRVLTTDGIQGYLGEAALWPPIERPDGPSKSTRQHLRSKAQAENRDTRLVGERQKGALRFHHGIRDIIAGALVTSATENRIDITQIIGQGLPFPDLHHLDGVTEATQGSSASPGGLDSPF